MESKESVTHTARTARMIAYSMLGFYGLALSIIAVTAAIKSGESANAWLELLKSGFLLLGGGLTTIIGYYFGSRGVQEAQEMAEHARTELARQKEDFESFKREFSPTADEEALILPDEEMILPDGGAQ